MITIRALAETHDWSLPAVVVCPASVTRNWAREFRRWAPGIKIVLIDDMDTPVPKQEYRSVVYIVSWSLLDIRVDEFLALKIRVAIADEAHAVKNNDAIRSQAFYRLTRDISGVLLLTGTPIINTQADLHVLHSYLGTDQPLMIRRSLEDVAPDIPEKKRSSIPITLREKDQAVYDKADHDFEEWLRAEKRSLLSDGLAEAEVERVLAAEALAKIGYLRRLVGAAKVYAAADWIARAVRLGEPVVVFLEHQEVLRRLSKALRKQRVRHCILEGSTSAKERQSLVDDFQAHKYPVFIGTRAATEGITLTSARHLLFVERFFTSAIEEQSEDRIRRIGQIHPTTMWYLHAVGTVDDRIDTIVQAKRRIIHSVLGSVYTAETPTGNIESMLKSWGTHVNTKGPVQPLGHGDPLPPLPSPGTTHAVVFHGDRWHPRSALRWCGMHGYQPERRVDLAGRFKFVIQPAQVFRSQEFQVFHVSRDIKLLVGRKLPRANERVMKRALADSR